MTDELQIMHAEHENALREECNKLTHGECRVRGCLQRGGWDGKTIPVDSAISTCIWHEISERLAEGDQAIGRLEDILSAAEDKRFY